jgi:hypothetical protein
LHDDLTVLLGPDAYAIVNTYFYLLALGLLGSFPAPAQQPLALVQTIEMPEVPAGPYADHMALDLEG